MDTRKGNDLFYNTNKRYGDVTLIDQYKNEEQNINYG